MGNIILTENIDYTLSRLTEAEQKAFYDSVILITGCGGFLGRYYLSFFKETKDKLRVRKVIGVDTFTLDSSPIANTIMSDPLFDIRTMDVSDIPGSGLLEEYDIDYVFHMASIASPTFYRMHPLETIDSNIWGIRSLLDAFIDYSLKGFLFYSSSEVYGDPDPKYVPTPETYTGNVETLGPRACYDESKRFGETLCWVYSKLYNIPIRIVRLFNVYGPGLNIKDRRAPADFARSVIENNDIVILSNGQPRRTFCYVADSVAGEIKAILSDEFNVYNIGSDSDEMTILEFAQLFREIGAEYFGYTGQIRYEHSDDDDYLTHNPQRRCPDITKAEKKLGYYPSILPAQGVHDYIRYLLLEKE